MRRAIGGYFELELQKKTLLHPEAVKLNSGRNAFEYILLANNYKKIYIPYFTCDVILEPLKRNNIQYEFYSVDANLEPQEYPKIQDDSEAFLYTNYFGIKDNYISILAEKGFNVIIDNAQSFFSEPWKNISTFYSPRKFFGLPDGGLAYSNKNVEVGTQDHRSIERMSHLLIRMEYDAEAGYEEFCKNDASLINQPLMGMSRLTQMLMQNIDYEQIADRRLANFDYLHQNLKDCNLLQIDKEEEQIPLLYPFRTKKTELRQKLLQERIFTPRYWPNVKDWTEGKSWENELSDEIVCLPIDQRYDNHDMERILKILI